MKKLIRRLIAIVGVLCIVSSFCGCSKFEQLMDRIMEDKPIESAEEESSGNRSPNKKDKKQNSAESAENENEDEDEDAQALSENTITRKTSNGKEEPVNQKVNYSNAANAKISGIPDVSDVISSKMQKNTIAKAFAQDKKYSEHGFPSKFGVQTAEVGVRMDLAGLVGFEIYKLQSQNGKLVVVEDSKSDMDSAIDVHFITANGSNISQQGSYLQINKPDFYLVTALYENPNPISHESWAPEKNSAILQVIEDEIETSESISTQELRQKLSSQSESTDETTNYDHINNSTSSTDWQVDDTSSSKSSQSNSKSSSDNAASNENAEMDNINAVVKFEDKSDEILTEMEHSPRKATVTPQGKIVYKSSNPSVATVNHEGDVNAESVGKTTITASCGNSKDSYQVIVEGYGAFLRFTAFGKVDNNGTGYYDAKVRLLKDGQVIKEDKWVASQGFFYNDLQPGKYRFVVTLVDNHDRYYESETETSAEFELSNEATPDGQYTAILNFNFTSPYYKNGYYGGGGATGGGSGDGEYSSIRCYTCNGAGYKDVMGGAGIEMARACPTCNGKGSISISGGGSTDSRICYGCNGKGGGSYVSSPGIERYKECDVCGGTGRL